MNSGPTLSKGSTGEDVSALQHGLLQVAGADTPTDPGPIDGKFGQKTEAAVKAYQTQLKLKADGIVGDLTWTTPYDESGTTLAMLSGTLPPEPQAGRGC